MSIKELTPEECYANMNSDIKLWEQATTSQNGASITKSLILPFGIGEMRVEFQGVDNGIKRRSAAEQWGNMVRDRIKNAIDDESVTARAQQAAAIREAEEESQKVGDDGSGDGVGDSATERLQDQPSVQAEAPTGAVQAHAFAAQDDTGPAGTDFAARAEWLRERIGEGERQVRNWRRELRALEAALSVLDNEGEEDA